MLDTGPSSSPSSPHGDNLNGSHLQARRFLVSEQGSSIKLYIDDKLYFTDFTGDILLHIQVCASSIYPYAKFIEPSEGHSVCNF